MTQGKSSGTGAESVEPGGTKDTQPSKLTSLPRGGTHGWYAMDRPRLAPAWHQISPPRRADTSRLAGRSQATCTTSCGCPVRGLPSPRHNLPDSDAGPPRSRCHSRSSPPGPTRSSLTTAENSAVVPISTGMRCWWASKASSIAPRACAEGAHHIRAREQSTIEVGSAASLDTGVDPFFEIVARPAESAVCS